MRAMLRRLDHVAIAVRDADQAIPYYRDVLGLPVVGDELAEEPGVRLVYLDAGNSLLQLVEPAREDGPVAEFLDQYGEGLHHVCFATDDMADAVARLDGTGQTRIFRGGRDRLACFLVERPNGVRVELTETYRSLGITVAESSPEGR